MRKQLKPFCTTVNCNRTCHYVHRQIPQSSSISSAIDMLLKVKRSRLRRENHLVAREAGMKSELVVDSRDDCGHTSGVSSLPSKHVVTLEEVIELARRKVSNDYVAPPYQKRYFPVTQNDILPVEEPAARVLELIKVNDLFDDEWAYVEQLMESDCDNVSPPIGDISPINIDNDEDIALEQINEYGSVYFRTE